MARYSNQLMLRGLRLAGLFTAGFVVVHTPARAQDSTTTQSEALEQVIVTGSRIARAGFEAPTPVAVVNIEALRTTNPQSITDGLRQVPQLLGTNFAAAGRGEGSRASSANAATGAYLNMRRLGPVRTLLLQDGFRVTPNRADGLANADLLPQLLVERVEVVTGGASAVYGSDAVAGVVNFITDTDFQGIKGVVQGGMSERSDYENYRVGIAAGQGFLDERLHVIGSVEHSANDGIPSMCDRDLGCEMIAWGGMNGATNAGTPSNPLVPYYNAGRSTLSFGGRVLTGPAGLAGMNFDSSGALVPSVTGTLVSNGTCIDCDGSNNGPFRSDLTPRLETTQAYGRFELDILDSLSLWGQASYGEVIQKQEALLEANQGTLTIYNGNAFLPANAQAALTAAGPTSSFTLGKQWLNSESLYHQFTSETLSSAAGVKGTIADRFQWNITGTWGRSKMETYGRENITRNLAAAIDAVVDPATGQIVCRVTLTNPGTLPGCAPLNPFGDYTGSDEGIAFAKGAFTYYTEITQKTLNANIGSDLFDLWAGPVSINVGAEYREVSLDATGNQTDYDNTGIRFGGLSPTLTFVANNVFPTEGSYDVKEVYGEAVVPLLDGVPLAESFELNVATRMTDYSTSGTVQTWKLGAVWMVTDAVRFRAARSRDIRAPNLDELFSPFTVRLGTTRDPVSGSALAAEIVGGGNLALEPEEADTTTIGVIVSPDFLPGFTASLDWYRIELSGLIDQPFSAQEIVDRCYASGGTDPICASIVRPTPTSPPTRIYTSNINIASQTVAGLDAAIAYQMSLGAGTLNFRANINYQNKNDRQVFPGTAVEHLAGFDFPKFNGAFVLDYSVHDWSLTLRETVIGKRNFGRTRTYLDPNVGNVFYTDMNLSRKLEMGGSTVEAFVNVQNLFDRQPPLVAPSLSIPGYIYPTDPSAYDVIGRQFTLGARVRW